jgi:hypothetical protein
MPDNDDRTDQADHADHGDHAGKPNAPIDLAAHRERRARLKKLQQQRAVAPARRDADAATNASADVSGPPGPGMGPGEVPCVHCKQPVFGYALRCPHCGVHFSGRAEAFAPKEGLSRRTKLIVALVAVALLLAGLSDDIAAWW